MFERVGEAEKKIFHILFQERVGGGHLSYLDAGGSTRGTQLMNMFVVTKFVINDCCLGSITSFFAPSRLFTIFIVIYLYVYSFFSSVEEKGCDFVNNFFCFVMLFVWRDFVTWQKLGSLFLFYDVPCDFSIRDCLCSYVQDN